MAALSPHDYHGASTEQMRVLCCRWMLPSVGAILPDPALLSFFNDREKRDLMIPMPDGVMTRVLGVSCAVTW